MHQQRPVRLSIEQGKCGHRPLPHSARGELQRAGQFPEHDTSQNSKSKVASFWQTTTRTQTFETKYARPPYMQPRSWLNCSFVCSSSGSPPANVDSRDNFRWTPQRDSSRYGHLQVLQELIDNGANVNATNRTIGPRYIFQHATDTFSNRYLNTAQTCMC
jgi:ankyrin repeat protein